MVLISFVFKNRPRMRQKYRIKYHEGTSMESLETDIEMAPEDDEGEDEGVTSTEENIEKNLDDREDEGEDDRHPLDRDEIMREKMQKKAQWN